MSTFLFASIPVPAHTSNPTPFAQRLIERGHTVLWYAGRAYHPQIAALGAIPLALNRADDFSGHTIEEYYPGLTGLDGPRAVGRALTEVFVGNAGARVADLNDIIAEHHVDAMLCDALMYGVGLVHELGGPVWATFGDGPLPYLEPEHPPYGPGLPPMPGRAGRFRNSGVSWVADRFVLGPAARRYDQIRIEHGLEPHGRGVLETWSPYLHLQGCTPGFEYPRRRLPPEVHWVGALRADPPRWTPPSWWAEVQNSRRAVVLVSQGTIRRDMTELVGPAIQALAHRDVLVVVTTGRADPADVEAAIGGPLPGNVRCTPFIPYDVVLPLASAFVTNGGYSGVTLALAHGVPLVQAGKSEEKSEIAARIRWSGVGICLPTTRPSPWVLADAVTRVLTEPSYAAAAAGLHEEMAGHDAGREGADLLEQLARTQHPAYRVDAPVA